MDTDCEMNRQFAKRLRRQQMCSPKSIVLRETLNTPPPQTSVDVEMEFDRKDLVKPPTTEDLVWFSYTIPNSLFQIVCL